MDLKLSIVSLLIAFIVFMAYWVVRTENEPEKESSFLDKRKSYKKAKEMGLNLSDEWKDVLPGV